MDNLLQELEDLKKRVSELESQKKSNLNLFGRSYSQAGNSNSDFLIKTKGQVKVQWGSKFIDIIKDGKINVDSKFIFNVKSFEQIGVKDGFYVVGNSVYLKIGGELIPIVGEVGTTYISFLEEQETSSEQKYTALQNIGFIYKDINSITDLSLKNGIIYVESEEKLYIVKNGELSEFSITFPNPFTEQFVIAKSNNDKGALLIKGQGINNSLAFERLFIYNEAGNSYVDSNGGIYFRIGKDNKFILNNNKVTFTDPVISYMFSSPEATPTSGFKLYLNNGKSVLEVDDLKVRNDKEKEHFQIYPIYWYSKNNIIKDIYKIESDNSENLEYKLELVFNNQYQVGDSLYAYAIIDDGETEYKQQIKVPFTVVEGPEDSVSVQINYNLLDSETISIDDILEGLKGQTIFLVGSTESPKSILKQSEDGIDLIISSNFEEETNPTSIKTRIGNLTELNLLETEKQANIPIQDLGIYSKQVFFDKAGYVKEYNLPEQDDSSKIASTEWVRKLINNIIPKGTIIAYHGDPSTLKGWHICDGNEGTPNLINKFIKAGTVEKEGGEDEVLLKVTNIPILDTSTDSNIDVVSQTKIKIEPRYYSLVFIMKI